MNVNDFDQTLLHAFTNCDGAALLACMNSTHFHPLILSLRTHNNFKYLALSLINCKPDFNSVRFVYDCVTKIDWPSSYIAGLRYSYNFQDSTKTLLICQFLGNLTDPETLRFDRLEVVQALVERDYPLAPLELATLILHDIDDYVFDQIMPHNRVADYTDEENDLICTYLITRFSELIGGERSYLEKAKHDLLRLIEYEIIADSTIIQSVCTNESLKNWLYTEYLCQANEIGNEEQQNEMYY